LTSSYKLKFVAPDLPPGEYTLTLTLDFMGIQYKATSKIFYVVPVFGQIIDDSENPIYTIISFWKNGKERYRFVTDSKGNYKGEIVPGVYNLSIMFPQSTLILRDVNIKSFNDPIKYRYFKNAKITGLKTISVFIFDLDISFYKAQVKLNYDDSRVDDESKIVVFECDSWSLEDETCNKNLEVIDFTQDKVRNFINTTTYKIPVYIIGTRNKINVACYLEKTKVALNESTSLQCSAKDNGGNPVVNASVVLKIDNGDIKTTKTNADGIFEFSLTFKREGNFTFNVSVEKVPFIDGYFESSLIVEKSKELSVNFPRTIRVELGSNQTLNFSIINTGQTDLYNLTIEIVGIPQSYYYLFEQKIDKIEVGEKKTIIIFFNVPANSITGTSSGKIIIKNPYISYSNDFGFTITEPIEKNERAKPTGLAFNIQIPNMSDFRIDYNIFLIFLFGITSFGLAGILKHKKKKLLDLSYKLEEVIEYLNSKPIKRKPTKKEIETELIKIERWLES